MLHQNEKKNNSLVCKITLESTVKCEKEHNSIIVLKKENRFIFYELKKG